MRLGKLELQPELLYHHTPRTDESPSGRHDQFHVVTRCRTLLKLCQVRVYSGKGSGQVRTETDGGQGQKAGQEISPAGVGDRLDSTTKDNEH